MTYFPSEILKGGRKKGPLSRFRDPPQSRADTEGHSREGSMGGSPLQESSLQSRDSIYQSVHGVGIVLHRRTIQMAEVAVTQPPLNHSPTAGWGLLICSTIRSSRSFRVDYGTETPKSFLLDRHTLSLSLRVDFVYSCGYRKSYNE